MNDTMMQAGLWIGAGFLLIMMLGRRRKRKVAR
jgi:LPXTG-motif cell wall-anchored protein